MDLQADAVDLGVHRDRGAGVAPVGERGGDVGLGAGEHRAQRPADLEADLGESLLAVEEGSGGDRAGEARQHDGAADEGLGHVGGPGHRGQEDPVGGSLAQLAGDQPHQPSLLVRGGAAEQLGDRGRAGGRRPGPGEAGHPGEQLVDLEDLQVGLLGWGGQVAQPPVADADGALRQGAGEVVGGDADQAFPVGGREVGGWGVAGRGVVRRTVLLAGGDPRRLAQRVCELVDLGQPRPGGGDGGGGLDHPGQPHGSSVPQTGRS